MWVSGLRDAGRRLLIPSLEFMSLFIFSISKGWPYLDTGDTLYSRYYTQQTEDGMIMQSGGGHPGADTMERLRDF